MQINTFFGRLLETIFTACWRVAGDCYASRDDALSSVGKTGQRDEAKGKRGEGERERKKETKKKWEERKRERSHVKRKERIVMAESEKGLKRVEKEEERERKRNETRGCRLREEVKKSENRAKRWNKSIVPNYYRETAWSWVYTRLQTSARNSRRYITFIIQHWPTLVIVPSILFSLSARGYLFTSFEYRINRFSALNRHDKGEPSFDTFDRWFGSYRIKMRPEVPSVPLSPPCFSHFYASIFDTRIYGEKPRIYGPSSKDFDTRPLSLSLFLSFCF